MAAARVSGARGCDRLARSGVAWAAFAVGVGALGVGLAGCAARRIVAARSGSTRVGGVTADFAVGCDVRGDGLSDDDEPASAAEATTPTSASVPATPAAARASREWRAGRALGSREALGRIEEWGWNAPRRDRPPRFLERRVIRQGQGFRADGGPEHSTSPTEMRQQIRSGSN